MTKTQDELKAAVAKIEKRLGEPGAFRMDDEPPLRLILAALRSPDPEVERLREALEQSTITLRMLKRNVEAEIKKHDGLFRWEGVPEAIQVRIDQSRAALSSNSEGR